MGQTAPLGKCEMNTILHVDIQLLGWIECPLTCFFVCANS